MRIADAGCYYSPAFSPLDRIDCCGYKNHEHVDNQKSKGSKKLSDEIVLPKHVFLLSPFY
jgi:hypothetical protein